MVYTTEQYPLAGVNNVPADSENNGPTKRLFCDKHTQETIMSVLFWKKEGRVASQVVAATGYEELSKPQSRI